MKYYFKAAFMLPIAVSFAVIFTSCESGGCKYYPGLYENHDEGKWFSLDEDTFEILSEKEPGKVITIETGKLVKLQGCEFKYIQDSDNASKSFTIRGKKLIQYDEITNTEIVFTKVRGAK